MYSSPTKFNNFSNKSKIAPPDRIFLHRLRLWRLWQIRGMAVTCALRSWVRLFWCSSKELRSFLPSATFRPGTFLKINTSSICKLKTHLEFPSEETHQKTYLRTQPEIWGLVYPSLETSFDCSSSSRLQGVDLIHWWNRLKTHLRKHKIWWGLVYPGLETSFDCSSSSTSSLQGADLM